MNTMYALALLFGAVAALEGAVDAQSPGFLSVTVTRSAPGETRSGLRLMPDGGLMAKDVTLRQLMDAAYQRHAFDRREIEGGPAWINTDRFDLVARGTGGHVFGPDAFPAQTWSMLRAVLEDRFKLKVRRRTREVPVYELRTATAGAAAGPRLRRVDVDCSALMKEKTKDERPDQMQAGRPVCAVATYTGRLVADAVTMPALANVLSRMLDRAVVDRTDLAGNFEVELEAVEINPLGPVGPSNRPSETKQSIVSAMPEQLGLKLEATTGPIEVLTIESVERPMTEQP